MEELLVAMLQFIFELLLNIGSYLPFDLADTRSEPREASRETLPVMAWLIFGGARGGISLLVFSHSLIHQSWLRIANVLLAPLISGLVSQLLSALRRGRVAPEEPRSHFWYAFSFSFAFALIRFTYAART